jgi:CTP:molybdopterin cytidylyltransferase MocA
MRSHHSNKKIAAIILAAGNGRRFGKPKWQGEYQGKNFLEIIKEKLFSAGFSDILCVKQQSFDIRCEGLSYVNNPSPEYGMVSSLYYGLMAFPGFKGYLVIPVDHPFIAAATIEKLIIAFDSENPKVIRPVFNGFPGHPVIIPGSFISILKVPEYPGGLRQLIKDSKYDIADIQVNDPNILKNINLSTDLSQD